MGDPVTAARHPDFSVLGRVLAGDVALIEANPYQLWIRRTPVLTAVPTTFYSNRNAGLDEHGSTSIELMPDDVSADPVDSGQLTVTAYGRGTGRKANAIRFLSRSGPNRITERMRITGDGRVRIGTDQPTAALDVRRNVPIGSADSASGVVRGGKLCLEAAVPNPVPTLEQTSAGAA